jgi:hypothetical protein
MTILQHKHHRCHYTSRPSYHPSTNISPGILPRRLFLRYTASLYCVVRSHTHELDAALHHIRLRANEPSQQDEWNRLARYEIIRLVRTDIGGGIGLFDAHGSSERVVLGWDLHLGHAGVGAGAVGHVDELGVCASLLAGCTKPAHRDPHVNSICLGGGKERESRRGLMQGLRNQRTV